MSPSSRAISELSTHDSLSGKTAVVTGSSKGIGRTIAIQLATLGADVLIHAGSDQAAAETTANEIHALGRRSDVVVADLADSAQQTLLVQSAWHWSSQIDIWINNAGADVLTGSSKNLSFDEKLERLWQVDVRATVGLCREVGSRMQRASKDPGSHVILNMGWDQVEHGMAGESGELFATTKGAVIAFSRSLAQSLAPGVRVNCLAPGWIQTEWGQQATEYWQQRAQSECLLQRWGKASDVANVAAFLVSPSGSFINGQVIAINGGFPFGRP